MRKAMAVVRLNQSGFTYRVQYFKIVTRNFEDIDFTGLISNREYHTLTKLCYDVIKLAKANNFKIEVVGDSNKIPDILIDKGNGTLLKYILAGKED